MITDANKNQQSSYENSENYLQETGDTRRMRGCYDFERTLVTLDTKGLYEIWKLRKKAKKSKKTQCLHKLKNNRVCGTLFISEILCQLSKCKDKYNMKYCRNTMKI